MTPEEYARQRAEKLAEHEAKMSGPEDEPDDSEDEGEGEEDEPSASRMSPEDFGALIKEQVESEEAKVLAEEQERAASDPANHPPPDPYAETCKTCNGFGEVYTGSKVEEHMFRRCRDCAGNGYTEVVTEIPLAPPSQNPESLPVPVAPESWKWTG